MISLRSKGLSRLLQHQFEGINSLVLSLFYCPALTFVHDYLKNHNFEYTDLCWQSNISAFYMLSRLVMEKAMAPHSSTLAWKIPWTEEPGGPQSKGSLRVGHDQVTSCFHFPLSCIGEGNGNPLQCSCLENPRDGGAWWAAVYGVAQSRTRLK